MSFPLGGLLVVSLGAASCGARRVEAPVVEEVVLAPTTLTLRDLASVEAWEATPQDTRAITELTVRRGTLQGVVWESERWPVLDTLTLRGVAGSPAGGPPPSLGALTWTDVQAPQSGVGDVLTGPAWMGQLTTLRLEDHPLSGVAVDRMAPHPLLRTLSLARSQGDLRLSALSQAGWFDGVVELDLGQWRATPKEVAVFAAGGGSLTSLTWTGLADLAEGRSLSVEGVRALCSVPWPALRHLRLDLHELGDEGLQVLASCELPVLESLNVRGNGATSEGLAALKAARPRVEIVGR